MSSVNEKGGARVPTDDERLRSMGTDARTWAKEFCLRFGNVVGVGMGVPDPPERVLTADEDTMRTWFANAIEAGRAAGRASAPSPGTVPPTLRPDKTKALNSRGEWVPSIPEPMWEGWRLRRARCMGTSTRPFGDGTQAVVFVSCPSVFRSEAAYRGHYALVHILGLS